MERLQGALGVTVTGRLALGAYVFLPGAVRVSSLSATLGGQGGGPILKGTSTVNATGTLDHASVQVAITTSTVQDALVVPVNALLALSGGEYAVEVVGAGGTHPLVPVSPGLCQATALGPAAVGVRTAASSRSPDTPLRRTAELARRRPHDRAFGIVA